MECIINRRMVNQMNKRKYVEKILGMSSFVSACDVHQASVSKTFFLHYN